MFLKFWTDPRRLQLYQLDNSPSTLGKWTSNNNNRISCHSCACQPHWFEVPERIRLCISSPPCCRLAYQVVHVAARWMDTRFSTHKGFLIQRLSLQKGIWTGCPDAPSDGFVSHGKRGRYMRQLVFY